MSKELRVGDFFGSTIKMVAALIFIAWASSLLPQATTTDAPAFAFLVATIIAGLVLVVEALAGIVDTCCKRR